MSNTTWVRVYRVMYTDNFTEPEWLMRPLASRPVGETAGWTLSGRRELPHPHLHHPTLHPSPATQMSSPCPCTVSP